MNKWLKLRHLDRYAAYVQLLLQLVAGSGSSGIHRLYHAQRRYIDGGDVHVSFYRSQRPFIE